MNHAALRIRALVVVTVPVEVQHVLVVGGAERVQVTLEGRFARVAPRGIRGTVPEGHDEPDGWVALRLVHEPTGYGVPAGPRAHRVGLRIANESHVAIVEPVPVLAATAGRPRGSLRVGKFKPTLDVSQVVVRGIPLMVAPCRHVGGVLRPDHDVVEVLVYGRLPEFVPIGEIPHRDNKRWLSRGYLGLYNRHPGELSAGPDVTLDENREVRSPSRG